MTARPGCSQRRAASFTCSAVTASMFLRPARDAVHRPARRKRRAVDARQRGLAVLRVDGVGDEPRLGARQLALVDAVLLDLRDDGDEVGVERFQSHARTGHGVEHQPRAIDRGAVIPAARRHGDALLDDEAAVEPAGGLRREELHQHLQGLGLARRARGVGGRHPRLLQGRLLDLRIGERDETGGAQFRLLRPVADGCRAAGGDLPVGALGDGAHRVRRHVSRDNEDRVLRRIEAPVIDERVLAVETFDLMHPADDRRTVGVVSEQRLGYRLAELRGGIGVGAHAPLLQHHVALGVHHLVGEHEAVHAVRLECHHRLEVLARHALVVGRVVHRGEGVLLAAEFGDDVRELALGVLFPCP